MYMKYTNEFGYAGHMLAILINSKVIHHTLRDSICDHSYTYITYSPTYPSVETDNICIAVDNGSNNTVGGSYYSAHQAVGKFPGHHIDMVSYVHRKCQTRAA